MKIAIYAAPLVTRHITGIEQLARNVVAQWVVLASHHTFFVLLEDHLPYQRDFDSSVIDALPANFQITRIHPERRFSTMESIEGLWRRLCHRVSAGIQRWCGWPAAWHCGEFPVDGRLHACGARADQARRINHERCEPSVCRKNAGARAKSCARYPMALVRRAEPRLASITLQCFPWWKSAVPDEYG